MSMENTYHPQTAKLIARIAENMPEMSGDVMQGWIENPRALKKVLASVLCPPAQASAKLVVIDRSMPFDPAKFIGKGWRIEEGEEDERSLALSEVDLANVRLKSCLKRGENYITGEENLKRLKAAKHVRLDAKIFQTLWENRHLIPESWKEKTYIFFDGTPLRYPDGNRYVLYLYWSDGQWYWDCYWLGRGRGARGPSAVLASS